jgi:DNA-binding response OmpR family regulator
MSENAFISILIAEDNDVSREMMASILRTQGYMVYGAIDGESAIKLLSERSVDMALVDINMAPKGGFDFIRYLLAQGKKLPVVIVTGDDNSNVLLEANALGVVQVLHKPVDPKRLLQTVERILRRQGINPAPLAVGAHETRLPPEKIMAEVLQMAAQNVATGKGGPYAAILVSRDGEIVARGTSGQSANIDPTAHAEVMALRRAAEKLGSADLSRYILYCSSQPTRVGQAMIASAGIEKVFYGLSHQDIGALRNSVTPTEPEYIQIAKDDALTMFKAAQKA